MNTSKLADIAAITSSIAILVTLVFLVVQMQQNTVAIEAQTRQSILAGAQAELLTLVENSEITVLQVKPELTELENATLDAWFAPQLRSREYAWIQHQSGLTDVSTHHNFQSGVFTQPGQIAAKFAVY